MHDFDNAPRPSRHASYNDIYDDAKDRNHSLSSQDVELARAAAGSDHQTSAWSGGHTPVFTEDFEEEQYPAAGPHVRKASDLSDFTLPKLPFALPTHHQQDSEKTKTLLTSGGSGRHSPEDFCPVVERPPVRLSVPSKSSTPSEIYDQAPRPRSISIIETPPRTSPSSVKTRSRNVSGASTLEFLTNGVVKPRHMKSTSSRFSFDMIGAANQEKLLEDRHRQKALERQNTSSIIDDEGQFDDFDYDGMLEDIDGLEESIPGINTDADGEDDLNGLEEDVPGVNADAETSLYEGEEMPGMQSGTQSYAATPEEERHVHNEIGGFTFHNLGLGLGFSTSASSLSPLSLETVSTPRDTDGDIIGFALSKESPGSTSRPITSPKLREEKSDLSSSPPKTSRIPYQMHQGYNNLIGIENRNTSTEPKATLDDDMYFNDGMIDIGDDEGEVLEFDETLFDNDDTDQYGRPLRPLYPLPALYSPPHISSEQQNTDILRVPSESSKRSSRNPLRLSIQSTKSVMFATTGSLHHSRIDEDSPMFQQPVSLTHDTLSAYQSALAAAAHEAAASGRFQRDSEDTHEVNAQAPAPPDDLEGLPRTLNDGVDDFDYEDALDDDAIIAEANAEALASDSDGFYGQEFGFYSAPTAGEALFANGGYFGPGVDGLTRSKSGRVIREPNLTPITERSEYSNRNSLMSLPPSAHGNGNIASPSLAQLSVMMGDYDEENMSLSALLKMRRGAWGGSQASVRSSNGDGSPLDAVAEEGSALSQYVWSPTSTLGQARRNSGFSISVSETSSASASPTLTLAEVAAKSSYISPPPPPANMMSSLHSRSLSPKYSGAIGMIDSSDRDRDNAFGKQGRSHRHTGSADSISYVKEEDPVKGERWVLERRRTAESGEIELLGRSVVDGGRI